ncbi:MAG: M20/M25/M40 family metallo-hydrolase [Bdellovibrionales bacterium]
MDLVREGQHIIGIDSGPFHGSKDICAYFSELAEKLGLSFRLIEQDDHNQAILINETDISKQTVFVTNLDTKDPGPYSFWTKTNHNPFEATIAEDFIYGLGSADSKLCLLTQMQALSETKNKNVALLGCVQQEKSSSENLRGLDSLPKKVIVSKPTGLRLSNGICGKTAIDIHIPFTQREQELRSKHQAEESTATQSRIFRAKSTHAAISVFEETAFGKLFDYLEKLPDNILLLNMECESDYDMAAPEALLEINLAQPVEDSVLKKFKEVLASLLKFGQGRFKNIAVREYETKLPRLHFGTIHLDESGIKFQIIAYFPKTLKKEMLDRWLKDLESNFSQYSITADIFELLRPELYDFPPETFRVFQDSLNALSLNSEPMISVAESDGRLFANLDVPTLVFGPGKGLGNIHEPNEKIKIDELKNSVVIYKNMMEAL